MLVDQDSGFLLDKITLMKKSTSTFVQTDEIMVMAAFGIVFTLSIDTFKTFVHTFGKPWILLLFLSFILPHVHIVVAGRNSIS